ncbi:MAG: hypothetical protein ACLR7K_09905 [Subdoligranulum sp.]
MWQTPNMFLSGAASYLRLITTAPSTGLQWSTTVMEDCLSEYFDQVWNLMSRTTKERNAIAEHIHHVLQESI